MEKLIYKRKMLRHGFALVLLGLITGFFIPMLLNPRAGVTAHLEGVQNGMLLLLIALFFPDMELKAKGRMFLYWGGLYGAYANYGSSLLTAMWGTYKLTPIASEGFDSAPAWQENLVFFGFASSAVAITMCIGICLFAARGQLSYRDLHGD